MLKNFLRNQDGNYAAIFAIAMLPLVAGVGISVDYSNISRLKHSLGDSTDAAGLAVSKVYAEGGKTDEELKELGRKFFEANFDPNYLNDAVVQVILPGEEGTNAKELTVKGTLKYKTLFGPAIAALMGAEVGDNVVLIQTATLKMRSLAEIALVLDNSGSMAYDKSGKTSGVPLADQRLTLLKTAAKELVSTMITAGEQIEQVSDAVKFSVVPFAASVNVGASNATASWMDTRGISPIHHEHLNWGVPTSETSPTVTNPTGYYAEGTNGSKLDADGKPLTRFSIYNALAFRAGGSESSSQCNVWRQSATSSTVSSQCAVRQRTGTVTTVGASSQAAATAISSSVYNLDWLKERYSWKGCVEARPDGYDLTDDEPSTATPSTLFVPMFAPDDFNASRYGTTSGGGSHYGGYNNWWPDYETDLTFKANSYWPTYNDSGMSLHSAADPSSSTWRTSTSRPRMADVAKYFANKPYLSGQGSPTSTSGRIGQWQYFRDDAGPNQSCTTAAIKPLTGSESSIHQAIDAMEANGNTNVPEGLAWGWRSISSGAPFTEGVPESRKDIDKVVIVLTDGFNTYRELSAGSGGDVTRTRSSYAAYGYTGYAGNGGIDGLATESDATNITRMYKDTEASKTSHNQTNFQKAMDERMLEICDNIKGKKIMLMTVALDLNKANYDTVAEQDAVDKAIETLTNCAGDSRTRKNSDGSKKKLFWNATSDTLDETFKEIADELSNLRFTG
jgi:Flp pilus assembly protein TadG